MKEIIDGVKGAWEVEARYYSGIVEGNKIIISCISGEGLPGNSEGNYPS